MKRYVLDINWQAFASDMKLSLHDVLRYASLPRDFFTRTPLTVTADEYFRLWRGIEYVMKDIPAFPLVIGKSISPETFNPLIFAALYSRNMTVALNVMVKYKSLVGPIKLKIHQPDPAGNVHVECVGVQGHEQLPSTLVAAELIMWVQIARIATREPIVPLRVHISSVLSDHVHYEAYFGTRITQSEYNGLTFSSADMKKPFLTANTQMLSIFEPILHKRLHDLTQDLLLRDQVRAYLVEIMASGDYSLGDVADRLGMSARTLQRKLKRENTHFQKELDTLREELARYYLSSTDYTSNQIAFLLGYEEPASFFRAFRAWTGQTPEHVRCTMKNIIPTHTQ